MSLTMPRIKLLWVDDDPIVRTVVEFAFSDVTDFELRLCNSGEEALAQMPRFVPHIVALDLFMPGMDGPVTMTEMRKIDAMRDVPVVFVTAESEAAAIDALLQGGARGVIRKPLDTGTLASSMRAMLTPGPAAARAQGARTGQSAQDPHAHLATLQELYAQSIQERIADIKALHAALGNPAGAARALSGIHHQAHTLAGSAATFGYTRLGLAARTVEGMIKLVLAAPQSSDKRRLVKALDALYASAEQPADSEEFKLKPFIEETFSRTPEPSTRTLAIVEDDRLLSEKMAIHLSEFGWRVTTYDTIAAAEQGTREHPPDAVIFDIMLPEGPLAGPEFMALKQSGAEHPIPLVAISSRWDWQARLAAAKAGADAYMVKPLDLMTLADTLDGVVGRFHQPDYRVLILDDNQLLARHFASVLNIAGMDCATIFKGEQLIDALAQHKPEVILLDFHLPECNGVDAARVIRQDPRFLSVPIIFLTQEENVEVKREALFVGADDFLHKPIDDRELIFAVTSRAERFRTLSRQIRRDGLTGLLNHIAFKLRLESEVERSKRTPTPLALAMIDIDHFKRINDRYGHPVGDQVIRSLGRLFASRFRASDIVGRYGGEEFAIVFPATDVNIAERVLNQVRESFSRMPFTAPQGEFFCTFSAGVAALRPGMSMTELIAQADRALYAAKDGGRNLVRRVSGP